MWTTDQALKKCQRLWPFGRLGFVMTNGIRARCPWLELMECRVFRRLAPTLQIVPDCGPAAGLLLPGVGLRRGAFFDRDALEAGVVGGAPGAEVGVVFEEVVDDAAVVGIEREGLHRAACGSDDAGELLGFFHKGVVAHGAVVLDVDEDAWAGWGLRGKDAVDEVLEVFHHFLAASDEAFGFVGEDLEHGRALVIFQFDGRNEAEIPEDGVEDFSGLRVHGEWRFFFFFLACTASRLATMLFFSRVGRGLFRVR